MMDADRPTGSSTEEVSLAAEPLAQHSLFLIYLERNPTEHRTAGKNDSPALLSFRIFDKT
jgi:hypothetical protein